MLLLTVGPIFGAFNSALAQENSAQAESFWDGTTGSATLTSDTLDNVRGGVRRGATVVNNLDLVSEIDTAKAHLWNGGRFRGYIIADWGGSPINYTGALQNNSNIDAPDTAKIYEAFYEHTLFDESLSVLVGLHNYNSEFDVAEYGGLFLNASSGIGQDLAQVAPSIFPTSAIGVRVKLQPTERIYGLFGLYDGVPGDSNNEKWSHIIFKRSEGLFYAAEVGLHSTEEESPSNLYKISLGSWYKSSDFTDYREVSRGNNHGFYLTLDKSIFRESDTAQGLGAYLQFGIAPGDRNQTDRYIGAGLQYTGLFPLRDNDIFGIALARAENSDRFESETDQSADAENLIELTYRAPLTEWLTLQPDIQYVVHPGAATTYPNALVLILRAQMTLE